MLEDHYGNGFLSVDCTGAESINLLQLLESVLSFRDLVIVPNGSNQ